MSSLKISGVMTLAVLLSGCSIYGRTDINSVGYQPGDEGLYAKLQSVTDVKNDNEIKIRDAVGTKDLTADRVYRVVLSCGRRNGGIGSTLTTREILVKLAADEHLSFAPLMQVNDEGRPVCTVLVNVMKMDGSYRTHEFDRQPNDSGGRDAYDIVPTKKAKVSP